MFGSPRGAINCLYGGVTIKILVGSKNPVKVKAAKEAFSKYFDNVEALGFRVSSGVSDQPLGEETFEGAKNRALELQKINKEQNLNADFFVGIEGGVMNLGSRWLASGTMCLINKENKIGYGMSPHFELPEHMAERLKKRVELGKIIDEMMGEKNTKTRGGAIGFFTRGKMDRKELYIHGLVNALVPFLNESIYFKK